ncbi:unnamed protein product, partial [Heterosigma akashiwo]
MWLALHGSIVHEKNAVRYNRTTTVVRLGLLKPSHLQSATEHLQDKYHQLPVSVNRRYPRFSASASSSCNTAPATNHETHQERCVFSMMYSSSSVENHPEEVWRGGGAARLFCGTPSSSARSAGVLGLGERVAAQLLHAPPQRR